MAIDLFDSLFAVVAALEREGIEHALVGGLALAVDGAPRATADIDVVIAPDDADRPSMRPPWSSIRPTSRS